VSDEEILDVVADWRTDGRQFEGYQMAEWIEAEVARRESRNKPINADLGLLHESPTHRLWHLISGVNQTKLQLTDKRTGEKVEFFYPTNGQLFNLLQAVGGGE
jgi:hypothetical protein